MAVVLSSWRDSGRSWSALVAFEVSFKLLQAWLLTPFIAVALGVVMARADKVAVNDWDMPHFLRVPRLCEPCAQ